MMELHRRWSDFTRFFVVVSQMGCIALVYAGTACWRVLLRSLQRPKCPPWLGSVGGDS